MERTIEFKNFQQDGIQISADLYLDGEFVVRLLDNVDHLMKAKDSDITLYEYFRKATLYYLSQNEIGEDYLYSLTDTMH